jgi:hypothetical protein
MPNRYEGFRGSSHVYSGFFERGEMIVKYRNIILIILVFLFVFNISPVFADSCDEWNNLDVPTIFEGVWTILAEKFPFSILVFAIDILDSFSAISPTSPASIQHDLFGTTVYPFWFIGASSLADAIFLGIRLLVLIGIIFGIVKHVLEVIL